MLMEDGLYVILILFVNDLLLTRNHFSKLMMLEEELEKRFEMSQLNIMHLYIGVEFLYLPHEVMLQQHNYAHLICVTSKLVSNASV
jgi:hypothetical protein